MVYEDLLLEKRDGIATITLNAPQKMNALTLKMQKSLPLAVDEVAQDDEVRVVIVTGAGERAFSAGGDLEWLKTITEGSWEESRHERLNILGHSWADAFLKIDKPVIAAINGVCVGAGFSLALSCDIRIAAETARFGLGFISIGLVPDCAMTYFLPRVVGTAKALELMFTGEVFSAAEAERWGVVSRVIPLAELMKVAQELAARIAQQPPIALELTKRVVYRSTLDNIAHHLDWETYAQQICLQTEDCRESMRAFLEKRPRPQFKGK